MNMNPLSQPSRGRLAAVILLLVTGLGHVAAQAQDCAISYTRAACPGKDAESYAKCDGKQSCVKKVEATSAQACQALALKACANDRLDITRSKVIGASYKGSALESPTGKADFCVDYDRRSAEFDKCGN